MVISFSHQTLVSRHLSLPVSPNITIMLALSPSLFSTFGWPLEDPISHEQDYNINSKTETSESLVLQFPSPPFPQVELDPSTPSAAISGGDHMMAKKLNHNASERDRRKKINNLYSSLRSLLPTADQMKKSSIPTTVSHVVKYIPELQQEVEKLIQKKEELSSKINTRQGELVKDKEKQRKGAVRRSLSSVSVSRIGDREIVVQISTLKVHTSLLSEVLLKLQEDGLIVINASSFESFGGRVFHNIHLQVEGTQRIECEVLSEKLLSLIV